MTYPQRLLHVRGGVSTDVAFVKNFDESSPRPWRCFCCWTKTYVDSYVFSTSVEVFLASINAYCVHEGLLHVRGGVSIDEIATAHSYGSSPRPWRCFQSRTH